MSWKLSKEQLAERERLVKELREKREALEEAVIKFKETIATAHGDVATAHKAYDTVHDEVRDWVDQTKSDFESEFEDKSDTWKEGERGEAVQAWLEEFLEVSDTPELQDCPEYEEPEDDNLADDLENIPDEPSF